MIWLVMDSGHTTLRGAAACVGGNGAKKIGMMDLQTNSSRLYRNGSGKWVGSWRGEWKRVKEISDSHTLTCENLDPAA